MSHIDELADEIATKQATRTDLIAAFKTGFAGLAKLTKGLELGGDDEDEHEDEDEGEGEGYGDEDQEEPDPDYAGAPDMNKASDLVDVTAWMVDLQGRIEDVLSKADTAKTDAEMAKLNARLGRIEHGLTILEPLAKGVQMLLEQGVVEAPSKADQAARGGVMRPANGHPRLGASTGGATTGLRKASDTDLLDALDAMNKGIITEDDFSYFKVHGVFSTDPAENAAALAKIKG